MDETKIALPQWLPWATTACLAALVACLGELWMIEKTRNQMMRDESLLNEAALKAAQNQLEAERIVDRRELDEFRSAPGPRVAFLAAPAAGEPKTAGPGSPWGVVTWDPAATHAVARFSGLPALAPDREYQLWLGVPGPNPPVFCGAFHEDSAEGIPFDLRAPAAPGCRILLVDGQKGGAPSLDEATAGASIILATLPLPGKI